MSREPILRPAFALLERTIRFSMSAQHTAGCTENTKKFMPHLNAVVHEAFPNIEFELMVHEL